MFNDDRSDFAAPIAAFLYIALAALLTMVYVICLDSSIWQRGMPLTYFLGLGGLVIAGFNLYKGYLAEGFSVALFVLYVLAFDAGGSVPVAVGLGVLFAFCALVSYKTGILDLAIIDAIAAVSATLLVGVEVHESVRALVCILGFASVFIALYVAYCDWTFAQDIIESFEDDFLDDECDCEDHPEGCTCECCADKADEEAAEEPAAEETAEAEEAPAQAEEAAEEPAAEEAPAESEESAEERKEE